MKEIAKQGGTSKVRIRLLVMVDWYAPGYKAGGPIRSAVNLSEQMEGDVDVMVLTSDRDLGEEAPYPGVEAGVWTVRGGHRVFYAPPSALGWRELNDIIRKVRPDVVYLNSMFSVPFTVYPLLMQRLCRLPARIVLAPRGMLMVANLAQKPFRKNLFLRLFKWLGLPKRISFHATDATEVEDIRRVMGKGVSPFLAGNLPGGQSPFSPCGEKEEGSLKMVYVGRMHPLKNLSYLLQVLERVGSGHIELTVVASMEDRGYWEKCREIVERLPQGMSVRLMEDVPHERIEEIVRTHHVFAYPTKGENFSHSIFGALSAGRPALISDRTPWRSLSEVKAGWDLPLEDMDAFVGKVHEALGMDLETLNRWCRGAWEYAHDYMATSDLRSSYLRLFEVNGSAFSGSDGH
jgi:glycosyltransferase involved in cell wall biosynthesis